MTTEEIRLIVGANVRRRRVELGLSQRALGDAVELSGAQINRISSEGVKIVSCSPNIRIQNRFVRLMSRVGIRGGSSIG